MNANDRLKIVQKFYYDKTILQTGNIEYKNVIMSDSYGTIDVLPVANSGVWGYEGDSISVIINGRHYKSDAIIKLNSHKIIKCND